MNLSERCSHGKTWNEQCDECDRVSFEHISLPLLKRNCQAAVSFYEEHPGYVGPGHVIDLYKTVAHLCKLIEQQLPKNQP